ncbi:hypothetical protein [uncultured Mobiluncus sp.]|uniref:hypothetical protein n=1 Tax=uncultured Mobiluncus sp. TaxID=293425 RepID=UPI00288B4253|nr:hypothetical protein [uncultured Mobiluncus sp.]
MVNDNPLENVPAQNNTPATETTPLPPPPDSAEVASQHHKLAYTVGAIGISVAVVLVGGVAAVAVYQHNKAEDLKARESLSNELDKTPDASESILPSDNDPFPYDTPDKDKADGGDDAATRYGLEFRKEDPLTWDDIMEFAKPSLALGVDTPEELIKNDPLTVCDAVTLWVKELHNYGTDIMCDYNDYPEYPGKIVISAYTISGYVEQTNVVNTDALFVVQPDGTFHCIFELSDINTDEDLGSETKDYDYFPSGNELYRDYLDLPIVRSNPERFTVDDAY